MAPRAKTPPSPSGKSKKSAAPAKKSPAKVTSRPKPAKPVKPAATKKTPPKLLKTAKSKPEPPKQNKKAAASEPIAAPTVAIESSRKRATAKTEAPIQDEQDKNKKRGRKPVELEPEIEIEDIIVVPNDDDDEDEFDDDEVMFDPDNLDRDEDEDEDNDGSSKPRKAKREITKKPARARKRSATEEFLEEDMDEVEDVEDPEVLDDLDPFATTIILDPDLPGPPPAPTATPAQLPPRPKRLAPRMQACVDCGQQFGWLSIEKVCFHCLKKRVAQRKKDEDYSGYGGTDDAGGDDDY